MTGPEAEGAGKPPGREGTGAIAALYGRSERYISICRSCDSCTLLLQISSKKLR